MCWDSKDRDNLSVLFISKEVLWSASLFIKRLCFLKAYSFCVWNDRKECCRHATALPAWYYVPKLELVKVWDVKSQPFCFSVCNLYPILCFFLGWKVLWQKGVKVQPVLLGCGEYLAVTSCKVLFLLQSPVCNVLFLLKVRRSWSKIVEPQLLKKNKQTTLFFILTTWKYLKFEIEIQVQVFPSCQDRKTNSFLHFLGEVTARQFSLEIYWPLRISSIA